LYVSPYWPERPASASELRALHVGRALEDVGRVDVLRVDIDSDDESGGRDGESDNILRVRSLTNKSCVDTLRWVVDPRMNYPHGVGVGERGLRRLLELSARADIVWFFKLRTANLFARWAWPRSVVDVDDVPSMFERSVFQTERSPRKRLSTMVRLWSWRRRDRLLGERFTVVAVCSDADKKYLQELGVRAPMHIVPNGFERPETPPVRVPSVPPRIGFIGVLDHEPNLEGIRWFTRHCWPEVKRNVPDARLRLVGRYSDGPLKPEGQDVDGLGWLADPAAEIATWSTMVVPVHIGAGTRGKIAHAFSQKCPVVSTSLGAYGYGPRDGHDMFIAETAETFAAACIRTIQQSATAAAMAERAWQQYLENWTWEAIRPRVWSAAEDCLRAR
jgi:hypothetical protein